MITFSALSLGIALLFAAVAILSVSSLRDPNHVPVVVGALGIAIPVDSSGNAPRKDVKAASDWNIVELNDIFSVEKLLDTLEASHASKTEVELAGEDKFTVRWR